jgi:uncharacterized protein GlcG (DUF336 family)
MRGIAALLLAVGTTMALAPPVAAQAPAGLLTVHDLSFGLANEIAQEALRTCRGNGFKVTVTVLDRAAEILVVLHDDGASPHTLENSRRKAYTARTFRAPSAEFAARYAANPAGNQQVMLANVVAAAGALPIKAGDEVVGSVGVSGSPGGDKDEACAKAGIDKVADRLK